MLRSTSLIELFQSHDWNYSCQIIIELKTSFTIREATWSEIQRKTFHLPFQDTTFNFFDSVHITKGSKAIQHSNYKIMLTLTGFSYMLCDKDRKFNS